jgi:hypothetical protein
MVRRIFLITFALILSAIFGHQSTAAEITCISAWGNRVTEDNNYKPHFEDRFPSGRRPKPTTCQEILIKGEIASGDSSKFARIVRDNHPFLDQVTLWSSGGLVEEALKIGQLIRKAMLKTYSPIVWGYNFGSDGVGRLDSTEFTPVCKGATCNCASACALIWAAGITRGGGLVGLHRPSIQSTSFANLPPDQASILYRQLLRVIEQYLIEMEVPSRFMEMMTDTSSTDIRWLDIKESTQLEEVPSIAEWITASCGGTFHSTLLSDNSSQVATCEAKKIDMARDSISVVSGN